MIPPELAKLLSSYRAGLRARGLLIRVLAFKDDAYVKTLVASVDPKFFDEAAAVVEQLMTGKTQRRNGGLARAKFLSPKRRSEIASRAAKARWASR